MTKKTMPDSVALESKGFQKFRGFGLGTPSCRSAVSAELLYRFGQSPPLPVLSPPVQEKPHRPHATVGSVAAATTSAMSSKVCDTVSGPYRRAAVTASLKAGSIISGIPFRLVSGLSWCLFRLDKMLNDVAPVTAGIQFF